ncbi:complex I subunit 4 family protein [Paenibacillus sp. 1001270B_150601_E10]|uniref:complex I subunit 4 family protein n=1 Tax=Paenibacillus sp. 1001270B_150601_E10 TaxID=2787079 RepID=UPI00189D1D93|nr:NADH-quinone oxidoreductase subunit M [Paenibacillus sp. 1001270B_150601_E10]
MLQEWSHIPWLSILAFSPLLGVMTLLFVPAARTRVIRGIGFAATLIPLLLSFVIYGSIRLEGQGQFLTERLDWISIPLNIDAAMSQGFASWTFKVPYHLAIDGISLPLVLLTSIIATMAVLGSWMIQHRLKTYMICFLLLEIGMLGVFMARDLFLFFMFFEWTLVPSFFLIGIWGALKREQAANRFLVYNGIGSALMLVAFMMITATAGFGVDPASQEGGHFIYSGDLSFLMQQLQEKGSLAMMDSPANPFYLSESWQISAFVLLLIAFGIKLPIFPFHTWMLRVHAEAPAPMVMLHSGILLKMGAYGLIQFGIALLPVQMTEWASVIAILGVINIVYGALLAFVQKEWRLVLAYSSMSHMGFVLFGAASMNELGLQGAVLQMVSHGFISALFFLLIGSLHERTKTTRLSDLGGLAKAAPWLSGLLLFTGLASLGLPGLSQFPAELFALLGLFDAMPWITMIGALGLILSAAYVLRAVLQSTYGTCPQQHAGIRDLRLAEGIPALILTAGIVLLGIWPGIVSEPIADGIKQVVHILTVRG